MSEKEIRLEEVQRLKDHCDGHGVGTDNPDHTIRAFIRKRLEQIEREFAPKPAASSSSPFIASTPTTAVTPEAPSAKFVAGE